MTEAERIDAIEQRCRQYRPYPETLVEALVQYLKGQGTFAQARDEWQAAVQKKQYLYAAFITLSDGEVLDALDLRILDLCIIANALTNPLNQILQQSRFDQACDYLLKERVDARQLIGWMMILVEQAVDLQGQITRLGQRLLSYLPEQTDELLEGLRNQAQKSYKTRLYPAFIKLLVKAQPPYLDLAWQIAQRREQPTPGAPRSIPPYDATLGQCAGILLEADPARFTAWARKIAGPESTGTVSSRAFALSALMQQDPAQHIDLAVEAARSPLHNLPRYSSPPVQIAGLQAAIAFDSIKYWPLLDEAVVSRNYYLVGRALKLLAAADFDRARPTLQYCLARGDNVSAERALEGLLKQPWDGQLDYALSLLAHPAKGVRKRISTWLVAQGQAAVEGISAYLTHRRADARLAAAQTLARIGGEQVTGLLAARLDPEKSLFVKEAILDAVGVPAAVFQGTRAHSPEAITAEAEATLRYTPQPALAWFDADEAPALRWTTGEPVPPAVLRYLFYRQARQQGKDLLAARVHPVLALLDRSASGDLALALYRGWVSHGAASDEAWLLPLTCALADDRLAARLRHQIETWGPGTRRTLAAQAVRALALIESDAALDELNDLARLFTRGSMRRVLKEAIAVATAR
jgi:hypothetical protein